MKRLDWILLGVVFVACLAGDPELLPLALLAVFLVAVVRSGWSE